MKKNIYLLITALAFGFSARSQNAVPNGGFENWTSGTYDVPNGYATSNPETFYRCNTPFNIIKTTDSYHGSFAIQLNTNVGSGDTCFGFSVNCPNPNGGNPCSWQGGTAFNQVATGIRGYYKSNVMAGDTAGIVVAFRNGTTCLGMYMIQFYGVHNTYTPFSLTFNPPLGGTPDTMVFAAVSSDVFNNIAKNGSMLQLDSISLTGISTQPAAFNGDFENWTSQTLDKPANWYIQGGGGNSPVGVIKTTDKHAGTYALELQTYLGERCNNGNNCHPAAQGAYISTGYYPRNCSGMCTQMGGTPFTNQIDTLCFYYKFAPSGNDTADCSINFKKNGANVYGGGRPIYTPASTYQYMEIPFNTMTAIDTVIIGFQSSNWRDSLLSFIGTVFKVDDVHFKSQPAGIKTFDAAVGIKVFPNPSSDGSFTVSNVQRYDLVRVHNVYGQEVNAYIKKENDYAKIQIDNPGAYFVTVNAHGKITTVKVIVGKE